MPVYPDFWAASPLVNLKKTKQEVGLFTVITKIPIKF